ncbi:hypothetical protein WAI453_008102 [Rhynchosporium graminicola]
MPVQSISGNTNMMQALGKDGNDPAYSRVIAISVTDGYGYGYCSRCSRCSRCSLSSRSLSPSLSLMPSPHPITLLHEVFKAISAVSLFYPHRHHASLDKH